MSRVLQKKIVTVSLACLWLAVTSFAQNQTSGQKESLLIGPGDMLHIQVFDTPELDQHVRVADSGTVPLMFIGSIKLAGLSPTDAGQVIEKALIDKQYMRRPQVTVVVDQYATQSVSILGEVHQPGLFPLQTPTSILRVLSSAGGLTQLADRNITIERHGDANDKVNYFLSNTSDQAISDSVLVYPGDIVLVPKAGIIYVLGDVGRPGGYPMGTNNSQLTVMQAVAMAGSTAKTAISSRVRLIRKAPAGSQDMILSLSDIEKGSQPDLRLKPDDILFVPFSWMKNMAMSSSSIAASAAGASIYTIHP